MKRKARIVRPAVLFSLCLLIFSFPLGGCYEMASKPTHSAVLPSDFDTGAASPLSSFVAGGAPSGARLPASTARPEKEQLTEKLLQLYPADEISVIKVNVNTDNAPNTVEGVIVFQTRKDAVQTNLAVSVNGVLHITSLAKDEKGWRIGDAGEVSFDSPDSFEFALNNSISNTTHLMRIACILSNDDFTFRISALD